MEEGGPSHGLSHSLYGTVALQQRPTDVGAGMNAEEQQV